MKRIFDFAAAAAGLIVLFPVLLLLVFLVRVRLGSPVFFTQTRPGLHGAPFKLIKFRTMTDARDEYGSLLPDKERMTRFGSWLRSSSLDELPELWNVLRGEMSIVGPRPLLTQYLDRYTPEQARRQEARPGITGWAQINGRNAISWDEKFKLDTWYVDNQCMSLDIKIVCKTVMLVLSRKDIVAPGSVTAEEFMGKQSRNGKSDADKN